METSRGGGRTKATEVIKLNLLHRKLNTYRFPSQCLGTSFEENALVSNTTEVTHLEDQHHIQEKYEATVDKYFRINRYQRVLSI
ncbi:hypothetical protein AKO1_002529 [Acrasis kona]|uniref:Uncharacterized protein n=1 Tax=Acrasis kona TaxID=1008807 RepID=A0AAW2ZND0_9EUKA